MTEIATRRRGSQTIDDLITQTFDEDPKARSAAVHALCPCTLRSDVPEVWDRLLLMIHDPDVRVRHDVLHTLCDGSPRQREPEVVQALEEMYNDPDQKLRRKVRRVLNGYRAGGRVNVL